MAALARAVVVAFALLDILDGFAKQQLISVQHKSVSIIVKNSWKFKVIILFVIEEGLNLRTDNKSNKYEAL